MASYLLWILFQLKTHRKLFEQVGEKAPTTFTVTKEKEEGDAVRAIGVFGARSAAVTGGKINQENHVMVADDDISPQLSFIAAIMIVVASTTVLAFHTLFATDSIQGLMAQHGISNTFMGIVILPILSNDPEPLVMARRDKMDMCLSWTLERCMQTALMVVPLIVLIAWGMGMDDMTLDFDGFSVAALFASIVIVTYVVQEGKSNWLTGALLIKVFIIIGMASYYV